MRTALPGYLGTIALVTLLIIALPLLHEKEAGMSVWGLILLGVLAAFPASDLAIALINRGVTDWLGPRTLPRLELKSGVPERLRTLVVIPTLLTRVHEVEELVARLEIHYLANPEGSLHFALLSDWVDAPASTCPPMKTLRSRRRRNFATQSPLRSRAGRWRPFCSPSPPAPLERKRRQMDGLGTQARKA